MKHNPYKLLLWFLFIIVVLVNSFRLFIYGFIISFMIVIFDRAFFGTRKRSDTQFLNLFFTLTSFFALCYTFSPFFRMFEFEVSHPKWKQYEVVEIKQHPPHTVFTTFDIIEKRYTPIDVIYKDDKGVLQSYSNEVKHYGLIIPPPFKNEEVIEKELSYIHQRSLNKLVENRSIHVFEHPHKSKLKVFKGSDAFALRHSIGFQIGMIISYIVALILSIRLVFTFKSIPQRFNSTNRRERNTVRILLSILLFVYILIGSTAIHYVKFL